MRLISCMALLMVIPAVGLLTRADKFTDHKMPNAPKHKHTVRDSASFSLFKASGSASKFDYKPGIFTSDYRLNFFKPVYFHSVPLLTINQLK